MRFLIIFDVILFLLGMFVLGAALEKSGLLHMVSLKGFARAQTKKAVLFSFILLMTVFFSISYERHRRDNRDHGRAFLCVKI